MTLFYRPAPRNDCYGNIERIGLTLAFTELAAAQLLLPCRSRINLGGRSQDAEFLNAPDNAAFLADICRCLTSLHVFGTPERRYHPGSLKIVAPALVMTAVALREWDDSVRDFSALDRGGDQHVFNTIMASGQKQKQKERMLSHIRLLWLVSSHLLNPPVLDPFAAQWGRYLCDRKTPVEGNTDPFDVAEGISIGTTALWCVRAANSFLAGRKGVGKGTVDAPLLDRRLRGIGISLTDAVDAAVVFLYLRLLSRPLELISLPRAHARRFPLHDGRAVGVVDATTYKRIRSVTGRPVVLYAAPQVQEVLSFLVALTPVGASRLATAIRNGRIVLPTYADQTSQSLKRFSRRWSLPTMTATRLRKTGVALYLRTGAPSQAIQRQLCHGRRSKAFRISYRKYSKNDLRQEKLNKALPVVATYGFNNARHRSDA